MTNTTPPPPGVSHDPLIDALLQQAQRVAVSTFLGANVTDPVLRGMEKVTIIVLQAQADAGMWKQFGVESAAAFAGLTVEYSVRPPSLVKRPPIATRWDFSRTRLPYLATWEV